MRTQALGKGLEAQIAVTDGVEAGHWHLALR
jgi:hypothetical protein